MIVRILHYDRARLMPSHPSLSARKGRLSLSIDQGLLDRLESFKDRINLSAHPEQLFGRLLEQLENRDWAARNADALVTHGRDIAATGLAGAEFDRI
ncbi:MAG: hypothetical protein EYC67_14570 [Betaproteobacteria bacterium]|nr:MAG: hypothetical protein EYC67_14570 [Betaproteobacteria bacterium]